MSRRKVILILLAVAIGLIVALVEVNATYEVLNQGERPACMVYAVETCIDVMGEPSDIGVDKAICDIDGNLGNDKAVLDYYVSRGAITSYELVDRITEYPVIVITWIDFDDWEDGKIKGNKLIYTTLHASVLTGRTGKYYTGVNSWGREWGFDGHYRLYNYQIVRRVWKITLPDAEIWR